MIYILSYIVFEFIINLYYHRVFIKTLLSKHKWLGRVRINSELDNMTELEFAINMNDGRFMYIFYERLSYRYPFNRLPFYKYITRIRRVRIVYDKSTEYKNSVFFSNGYNSIHVESRDKFVYRGFLLSSFNLFKIVFYWILNKKRKNMVYFVPNVIRQMAEEYYPEVDKKIKRVLRRNKILNFV